MKKGLTKLLFIIDRSGSMEWLSRFGMVIARP